MDEIKLALKERYPHVHPLLFHRCVEKARTNGELFDMLESIADNYPLMWDEGTRSWIHTDLFQTELKEEK